MKRKAKPDFKALRWPPGSAPVDRQQWSIESQRSYSFFANYQDIKYDCHVCGARAIFSAVEQKRQYEVKKDHICTNRVLCPDCFATSIKAASDIRACERAWKESRKILSADSAFLLRWLESMAQYKRFQPYRHNFAIEAMIRKRLTAIAACATGDA
jgi:ribosomal protein S27AE